MRKSPRAVFGPESQLKIWGLVDEIGSLQDAVDAVAESVDLTDYEISYISQPLTTRELLIKRLNRILAGIFAVLSPGRSSGKKMV